MRDPRPAANITAVSIVRAHMESKDGLIAIPIEPGGHVEEFVGEEIPRFDVARLESREHWGVVDGNQVICSRRSPILDLCPHLSVSIEVQTICQSGSSLLRGCRPVRNRLARCTDSGL